MKLLKLKVKKKTEWQHITEGKVKLQEGYEVWIYPAVLNIIKGTSNNCQSRIFGQLLHHFLGEKLASLTSKKIPRDVYNASHAYALENATIPFSLTVGKCANNKCTTEKKKDLKRKKLPSTSSLTVSKCANNKCTTEKKKGLKRKKLPSTSSTISADNDVVDEQNVPTNKKKKNENIKSLDNQIKRNDAEQDSTLVDWDTFSRTNATSTPTKICNYDNAGDCSQLTTLNSCDPSSNQNLLLNLDETSSKYQQNYAYQENASFSYISNAQNILLLGQ
ncbi:uncharacterized protein LOC122855246 [Aphidius gifuensis]|uniref:uncharacterized protein LOC122855246 n=1 Tax=Aphidius gifuensis TaxID=684658 RepID=UPI001CDC3E07|nr:uncharacterized protein LOC122855246 [Aphidius gifuensis]